MAVSELDDELNELLDEALEDFEAPVRPKLVVTPLDEDEDDWSRDFRRSHRDPESVPPNSFVDLTAMEGADRSRQALSDVQRQLRAHDHSRTPPNSFAEPACLHPGRLNSAQDPLAEAMRHLAQSSAALGDSPPDEDVAAMFSRMKVMCEGSDAEAGRNEALLPVMETMMQSLLSKDLLYPAIRELHDQFPEWLAAHRAELSPAEFERFNGQFAITQQLCQAFAQELDPQDDAAQRRQFDTVMNLMQAMQALGHPPPELVGNRGPSPFDFPDLDPASLNSDQCNLS